jgi:hypothetical protein
VSVGRSPQKIPPVFSKVVSSDKISRMGNRWKNHTRRLCVEECERKEASSCPVCRRAVRFLYARPATSEFACQQCQNLTFFSVQTRKTRLGDLVRVPHALYAAKQEYSKALSSAPSLYDEPPEEICQQGRRAVARWFRMRDAKLQHIDRLFDLLNRVPNRLEAEIMKNQYDRKK